MRPSEAKTLIDKIKAEIKKRAELKAQRMLLKEPKRNPLAARLQLNSPKCLQSSGRVGTLDRMLSLGVPEERT